MPRPPTPRHPLTDQPFVVPAHADEFPVASLDRRQARPENPATEPTQPTAKPRRKPRARPE